MSTFSIMTPAEFEEQFPTLHVEVSRELGLGFVPNIFRCLALINPELAKASWQMVKHNLCRGNLPRMVKELVFSFVAYKRDCDYCYIAHHALAMHHGFPSSHVNRLFDELDDVDNPILRAVLKLADKATDKSFAFPEDAYKQLEALGLNTHDISEVLGILSCSLYMVNLADGLGLPVDERFIEIVTVK